MKQTTNPRRIKAAYAIYFVWLALLVFIVVAFASTFLH